MELIVQNRTRMIETGTVSFSKLILKHTQTSTRESRRKLFIKSRTSIGSRAVPLYTTSIKLTSSLSQRILHDFCKV